MAINEQQYKLHFYIKQFRRIFTKIMIVYVMSLLCILYLFYKINTKVEPLYYASSESGNLKQLTPYSANQAASYIKSSANVQ